MALVSGEASRHPRGCGMLHGMSNSLSAVLLAVAYDTAAVLMPPQYACPVLKWCTAGFLRGCWRHVCRLL